MLKFFYQGGPLFMSILSILLLLLLLAIAWTFTKKTNDFSLIQKGKERIKSIATLALVVGILGQLIGLFTAFSIMETSGGISPNILIGGLKVSMITTLYGIIIFAIGQAAVLYFNTVSES